MSSLFRYVCVCGKVLEANVANAGNDALCTACHEVHVIPDPLPTQRTTPTKRPTSAQSVPPSRPKLCCPACQSENFQRFAIVYESGITSSSTIGIGVAHMRGGFAEGVFAGETNTRTALAERIAPPEQESERGAKFRIELGVGLVLLAALFVFALIQVFTKQGNDAPDPIGGPLLLCAAIFVLPPLLLGSFLIFSGRKSLAEVRQYNEEVWPGEYKTWERSFLCLRCGCGWEA